MGYISMSYENLDLNLIKVFVAVCENGGIVSASKKLFISQPAVTMSIKKLESIIDCKLFVRLPRGIKLSPEGECFFDYCKGALNQIKLGLTEFENFNLLKTGTLTIGAPHDVVEFLLMPKIQKFLEIYPNININFVETITKRLPNYILRGDIDIAFLEDKTFGTDFDCFGHKELENVFFKPKTLNLCDKNKLFDEKIAIYKKESGNNLALQKLCDENNLTLNVKYTASNFDTLEKMCEMQNCLGFAPKKYINTNKFDIVKTDYKIQNTQINVCFPKKQNLSSACRKFIEFLNNN